MQIFAYWATISGFLINIAIFGVIFIVLFQKWNKSSTKYYSDLPFILAISFVFLIYDRIDSILGLTGIMPITVLTQLINLLAFVAFNGVILFILLVIWLPEKKTTRNVIMVSWLIVWFAVISIFMSIIGTPDTLHSVIFLVSIPMLVLFTVTFYFCHFQKRLSIINPLLVGIGATGMIAGLILRIFLTSIGTPMGYVFTDLHWIAIFLDFASYSVMLLGFSREASY